MNLRVKNALISVSNKENLPKLLKTLKKFNINILSSGGTYNYIKNSLSCHAKIFYVSLNTI